MSVESKDFTIAIAGNPNCGKTALFNALTGAHQTVGNWPGVTVEKKFGHFLWGDQRIRVVDMPGVYALSANSEDERVALDYLLSREADLVVNILDATNLERNLFLTTQLMEMDVPMVLAVNMMDIAINRGIQIDTCRLSESLGVPAIGLSAVSSKSCESFVHSLSRFFKKEHPKPRKIEHTQVLEKVIGDLATHLTAVAVSMHADPRWTAIQYLEGSAPVLQKALENGFAFPRAEIENALGEEPEFALADSRYSFIRKLTAEVIHDETHKSTVTDKIDKVFLNRLLGLPLFVGIMYLVFWVSVTLGSAFIDFFDISFGAVFVDGFTVLLESIGAPGFVVALLADGLGTGVQTVATFIPVIFFMFLSLAILEDSGYMARAAFVADRFMRFLGLPGKAFVPMLVGFGCSVPALMGTRTMENKRERFLTLFLVPFMSCGARLPVYALFGAAFFGAQAGNMVFAIYLAGIGIALLYGLLLRHTLFKGEASPFVMELPPYHVPRVASLLRHAWLRLREFVFRAGKIVLIMVTFLGFLGSIGTDGSFGNGDSEKSVLSTVGRSITPVFEPFGVEEDNWPASVALFTGLFAKEAVVGTLTSLYSINDEAPNAPASSEEPAKEGFSLLASLQEAVLTIPENLKGVISGFTEPIGLEGALEESESEDNAGVLGSIRENFSMGKHQVFAYLLFILLYVPCLAALGTAFRELGRFYGILMTVFQTILGWSLSVLYFQVTVGRNEMWILVSLALLLGMAATFVLIGKKKNFDS